MDAELDATIDATIAKCLEPDTKTRRPRKNPWSNGGGSKPADLAEYED